MREGLTPLSLLLFSKSKLLHFFQIKFLSVNSGTQFLQSCYLTNFYFKNPQKQACKSAESCLAVQMLGCANTSELVHGRAHPSYNCSD